MIALSISSVRPRVVGAGVFFALEGFAKTTRAVIKTVKKNGKTNENYIIIVLLYSSGIDGTRTPTTTVAETRAVGDGHNIIQLVGNFFRTFSLFIFRRVCGFRTVACSRPSSEITYFRPVPGHRCRPTRRPANTSLKVPTCRYHSYIIDSICIIDNATRTHTHTRTTVRLSNRVRSVYIAGDMCVCACVSPTTSENVCVRMCAAAA